MAVAGARVVVAATATVVANATRDRDGVTVVVQNPSGGASVYLGGSAVSTTAYGNELAAGSTITVTLKRDEVLYGVVATGTVTVNVLRLGA